VALIFLSCSFDQSGIAPVVINRVLCRRVAFESIERQSRKYKCESIE